MEIREIREKKEIKKDGEKRMTYEEGKKCRSRRDRIRKAEVTGKK